MAEIISCSGFEYRVVGAEMHRRPGNWEKLSPVEAAWLVLNRAGDFIPPEVKNHFAQAQNRVFAE